MTEANRQTEGAPRVPQSRLLGSEDVSSGSLEPWPAEGLLAEGATEGFYVWDGGGGVGTSASDGRWASWPRLHTLPL